MWFSKTKKVQSLEIEKFEDKVDDIIIYLQGLKNKYPDKDLIIADVGCHETCFELQELIK